MVSPKSIQEKGPNVDRIAGRHRSVQVRVAGRTTTASRSSATKPTGRRDPPLSRRHHLPHHQRRLNTAARTASSARRIWCSTCRRRRRRLQSRSPNVIGEGRAFADVLRRVPQLWTPAAGRLSAFVRRSNYAINRDEINKVIALSLGQPSSAILPKEHWAQDPATANYYTHDIAKAKSLLAAAGHPNGIDIDAYGWSDQTAMQRQELIMSPARQGRHSHQAHAGKSRPGHAELPDRAEGCDDVQPDRRLSRPEPVLRSAVCQGRAAQCRQGRTAWAIANSLTRRWRRPIRPSARPRSPNCTQFVIEQGMQLPQFVSPNIIIDKVRKYKIAVRRQSAEVRRSSADVWLERRRNIADAFLGRGGKVPRCRAAVICDSRELWRS